MAEIGSAVSVSQSATARTIVSQTVLPVAPGRFFPSQEDTKLLECSGGDYGAHLCQWRNFGKLYEDGSCKRILVKYLVGHAAGAALNFTPPANNNGWPGGTRQALALHDKQTLTFDDNPADDTLTDWDPENDLPWVSLFSGQLSSLRIILTFNNGPSSYAYHLGPIESPQLHYAGESIVFDMNIMSSGTEVLDDGGNTQIVKRYRQFRRASGYPPLWGELVWEIVNAGYPDALGAARQVRFWFRHGHSWVDSPGVYNYPSLDLTLIGKVTLTIASAEVDARIRSEEKLTAAWATGSGVTSNHTWELSNPGVLIDPAAVDSGYIAGTGTNHPFWPDGCEQRVSGELFVTTGIGSATTDEQDSYAAWKTNPGPHYAISRNWAYGDPATGKPYLWDDPMRRGTWLVAHLPRWEKVGEDYGVPYPKEYSEAGWYAAWWYVYKTEVEPRQGYYNRDIFAYPALGQIPGSGAAGSGTFLNALIMHPLGMAVAPTWDAYMVDTYKQGVRPQWYRHRDPTGSAFTLRHADLASTTSTTRRWPHCLTMLQSRPFVVGPGTLMGKNGGQWTGATYFPYNFPKAIGGSSWAPEVSSHCDSPAEMELYMMTGDYLVGENIKQRGMLHLANMTPMDDANFYNTFIHLYTHDKGAAFGERGWARASRTISHCYELTGDVIFADGVADRWLTTERAASEVHSVLGSPAASAAWTQGYKLPNRDLPDFLAGEVDNPTDSLRDPRQCIFSPGFGGSATSFILHPLCGDGSSSLAQMMAWSSANPGPSSLTAAAGYQVMSYTGCGVPETAMSTGSVNVGGFHGHHYWTEVLIPFSALAAAWSVLPSHAIPSTADGRRLWKAAKELEWIGRKMLRSRMMHSVIRDRTGYGFAATYEGPPHYPYNGSSIAGVRAAIQDIHKSENYVAIGSPSNGAGFTFYSGPSYYVYTDVGQAAYAYDLALSIGDVELAQKCYDILEWAMPGGKSYSHSRSFGFAFGQSEGPHDPIQKDPWYTCISRLFFKDRVRPTSGPQTWQIETNGDATLKLTYVDEEPDLTRIVHMDPDTVWTPEIAPIALTITGMPFSRLTLEEEPAIMVDMEASADIVTLTLMDDGSVLEANAPQELGMSESDMSDLGLEVVPALTLVDDDDDGLSEMSVSYGGSTTWDIEADESIATLTLTGSSSLSSLSVEPPLPPDGTFNALFQVDHTFDLTFGATTVDVTNIPMYSGNTAVIVFNVTDKFGSVVDLSGLTAARYAAFSDLGDTELISKSLGAGLRVLSAADGTLELSLDPDETAHMGGSYPHEMFVTISGRACTIISGNLVVEATRLS